MAINKLISIDFSNNNKHCNIEDLCVEEYVKTAMNSVKMASYQ